MAFSIRWGRIKENGRFVRLGDAPLPADPDLLFNGPTKASTIVGFSGGGFERRFTRSSFG
jgi:hypothetical protein